MLDADISDIVAGHIIWVFVYIFLRYLPDIAEHICSRPVIILAQNALLDIKTREAVELFLKASVFLGCEVCQESLWRIG